METTRRTKQWLGIVALAGLLTACAATPQNPAPPPGPAPGTPVPPTTGGETPVTPTPTPPTPGPMRFSPSGNAGMDAWRDDFATRAVASGRDPNVVFATLKDIRPLDLYLGDKTTVARTGVGDQAEFAKPIWDYVGTAVSEGRLTRGGARMTELSATFDAIEAKYGVDRATLVAIWAMETNLGSYIGTFDAANTLANMAVEGRRRSLGERELLALMKLQEEGRVRRDQLVSGWAGAMGQTQFMPSTFLAHAVDGDGDGRMDLWESEVDALASAANYLAISGYQFGQPWGLEIIAPPGFDWSFADGQDRRMTTWKSLGLVPMTQAQFLVSDASYAELWLPTGATGPKYLLFKNFDVFKTYNRSDSYALSVGLLANGVEGQRGPVTPWPTQLGQLSRRDIMTLQSTLNRLGFPAGPIDGIAGRGTKGALRSFQKANGITPADGYPTQQALGQVLAAASG
ncbi:MAG: lytic murein transglycosylase [Pseudomonadota bacterium]